MKTVVPALLLVLAGSSSATLAAPPPPPRPVPAHPPAPPSTACKVVGDVMFEIDHQLDIPDGPTFDIKLYDTGAWTFDHTNGDAPPSPTVTGCLAHDKLQDVTDHLAAASWTVTAVDGPKCHTKRAEVTRYAAAGKTVWTDVICSGQRLDDASRTHLAAIVTVLTDATGAH